MSRNIIIVGRWDCMTKDLKGLTKLNMADYDALLKEVSAEIDAYDSTHEVTDNNMGVYELEEFEIAFNTGGKEDGFLSGETYWMRIVETEED